MNFRILAATVIPALGALALSTNAPAFDPMVTVRTTMTNFSISHMVINCPPGPWGSAFQWDGRKDRWDATTMRLVQQIESKHGAKVSSKTEVQNFQTTSDTVNTVSKASPASGPGKDLCAHLAGIK